MICHAGFVLSFPLQEPLRSNIRGIHITQLIRQSSGAGTLSENVFYLFREINGLQFFRIMPQILQALSEVLHSFLRVLSAPVYC